MKEKQKAVTVIHKLEHDKPHVETKLVPKQDRWPDSDQLKTTHLNWLKAININENIFGWLNVNTKVEWLWWWNEPKDKKTT